MSDTSPGSRASAPPSISVDPIAIGDTFSKADAFRIAFELNMMNDKRQSKADKRVSGGKAKLYRCTGAIIAEDCRCCHGGQEATPNPDKKKKKKCKFTLGCPVFARGYKQADTEWHVTDVRLDHVNCPGQSGEKQKRASRKAIKEGATAYVNANPKMKSPELVKTVKETWGVAMVERTANRLKFDILKHGKEVEEYEYKLLHSYLGTLAHDSGGTIVDIDFDSDGRFVRCFMMLGAAARMATAGVQQVFAMDGANFRGEWNGVFTTLSFKDANNKIVHVATVVSAKEDGASYRYLLTKAMESPLLHGVLNNAKTTCFTDNHKGSNSALPRICPLTEDRRCVEHLLKAIGKVGVHGRKHVYNAAKAGNKVTFDQHMEPMKGINETAYSKLLGTPHEAWANYAGRNNVIWDQTTSNFSESLNNMIGDVTRAKTVLGFLHDIVLKTAERLHEASHLKKGDSFALITPFATATFNAEFRAASGFSVSPTGQGGYSVYPEQNKLKAVGVNLRWGASSDAHVYDCSCNWCLWWKMPCRHVLAAATASGTAHKALELVSNGYSLDKYRAAAADPNYGIVPPVHSALSTNMGHLPPLGVLNPAGRPKKGPRKRKRIESRGEHNTSSRTYAIHNAAARRTGGASDAGNGGGGSGGGAAGVLDLSQGSAVMSQVVTDLSQGPSHGE